LRRGSGQLGDADAPRLVARVLLRQSGLLISRVGLPNSSTYQDPLSTPPPVLAVISLGAPHSSASDTLQVRHSKVHRSGKPLNLTVFLVSRIGWAQLGHRGGFGAELLTRSGLMARLGWQDSVQCEGKRDIDGSSDERSRVWLLNKRRRLSATWLED
jgi:hypothetical protein